MLRDFSLRDFGASLNTAESYTNESSQGKIGLYETVSKQKCTHLGMFLASETYWRDGDGYFYTASKYDLPNKKNKAEWEQFHDNPDAVLIQYWSGAYHKRHMTWFDNISVFTDWWKDIVKNTPSCYATPKYEIVKRGYTKVKPDDRRVIFRLPYFPVDMDSRPPEFVARVWINEVDKRWYSGESDMYEHLVGVIEQWRKWKEIDKNGES